MIVPRCGKEPRARRVYASLLRFVGFRQHGWDERVEVPDAPIPNNEAGAVDDSAHGRGHRVFNRQIDARVTLANLDAQVVRSCLFLLAAADRRDLRERITINAAATRNWV